MRISLAALLTALGLLSPALALAQDPYGGPTTGAPNAAQNSFYNGGAPAATFQQPRTQSSNDQAPTGDGHAITGQPFEPGEVLAIVGNQYILAGDVLPHVNQVMESHLAKIPPQELAKIPPEQLAEQKRLLVAQLTGAHIEVKILYLAFLRTIPAEKHQEVFKKVSSQFDETLERVRQDVEKKTKEEYPKVMQENAQIGRLALLMKTEAIWSPGELDILLRKYGGSIEQEKRYYAEYTLSRAIIYKEMNSNPSVSHDEMLRYYREHEEDYLVPARARFEIMSTRFGKFPDAQAAMQAICAMGNEVYYGKSFAAVARQSSQGLNAEQGGLHDWTDEGALKSKPLNDALFTIEPNKLSQVIEDERGYHIIRVLERTESGKLAFEDVQTEIREKLKQEKVSKQYKEILQRFKEGTKVWTVFDEDPVLGKFAGRGADAKRR